MTTEISDEAVEQLARAMAAKLAWPRDGDTMGVNADDARIVIYPGFLKAEDPDRQVPLWKCFERHARVALAAQTPLRP